MENCLLTAHKNRINPFNSVVFPPAYQKCMEPPIFNDQKLFGLALDLLNVRKPITYVTDMSEEKIAVSSSCVTQMLTKLNQKPHSVTSFKIKVEYALKLAQRSACSPSKKRHAIFRLIKGTHASACTQITFERAHQKC